MEYKLLTKKKITSQEYLLIKSRNCDKGKHRLRTNIFGTTFCIICGRLSNSIIEEQLKDNEALEILYYNDKK